MSYDRACDVLALLRDWISRQTAGSEKGILSTAPERMERSQSGKCQQKYQSNAKIADRPPPNQKFCLEFLRTKI